MVATIGLTGLRPNPPRASAIASPPYDVIKPGTPLEKLLAEQSSSLFHIILGDQPAAACGAVQLGHGKTAHLGNLRKDLDLAQGVLAGRGIEHQQDVVGRARVVEESLG